MKKKHKRALAILMTGLLLFLLPVSIFSAETTGEERVLRTQGENELPMDLFDDEPSEELILGDINGDQAVDAVDALQALRHAVHQINLTGSDFTRADVNKDGVVDSRDGLMILQFSVGMITEF